MGRKWKPGDVVTLDASEHWNSLPDGGAAKRVAAFLREIEAMWGEKSERRLTANSGGSGTLQWLAEAFEAVSHDPKPKEPTGLGAVVEDAAGQTWVRTHNHWRREDLAGISWDDLSAVRVLSEGVPT